MDYLSDMWNILDFITNSLYVATITLRVIAYAQVSLIVTTIRNKITLIVIETFQ